VALTHHLVSKYTSLVAVFVTDAATTEKPDMEKEQATNLAPAQDHTLIAALPKTATSGQLQILLGLAMLALAHMVWRYRRQVA